MSSFLPFPVLDNPTLLTTSSSEECNQATGDLLVTEEDDQELDDRVLHPVYFDSASSLQRLAKNYAIRPGILPTKDSPEFELLRQSLRANSTLMKRTSAPGARARTWNSVPTTGLDISINLKSGSVQPVVTIHINGENNGEAVERFLSSSLALQHLTSPMVPIVLIVKSAIFTSSGEQKDLSATIALSPANMGEFVQIALKLVEEAKAQHVLGKASWSWEHRGKAWPEHSAVRLFRSRPRFELTAPAESEQTGLLAVSEEAVGANGTGSNSGKKASDEGTKTGLSQWLSGWNMCTMQ
ncbi:unnamed protein product [Zymoseptoria tritici ST99CH_1A5]|uniref:Uncharacterized protein n=2 Tax=Zymoseptoria tritici TaxID=1047171 RepID=A0A2H1GQ75_ZYMTR|nr:unnamed protein product [Zymoseptoria tritici ST99CH_1E4]SMR58023.1 unnamed protein product [Zymoseptoria tritici ST99CH_3D1]SMY26460.1 unnamed protein product [Zymoseptoria tritici ST99CH_1A5]